MSHNARCAASIRPECVCSCGGELHGTQRHGGPVPPAARPGPGRGRTVPRQLDLDGTPAPPRAKVRRIRMRQGVYMALPPEADTYVGQIVDGKPVVTVNGRPLHHYVVHSPTGFAWGYGGSGPADLALSILTHYFRERPHKPKGSTVYTYPRHSHAWQLHQAFKEEVLGRVPWNPKVEGYPAWVLMRAEIDRWLARHADQLEGEYRE
jgi:hypothetical protein